VFIPLGDAPNYADSRPWVNYGLIALNVGVYLWALVAHPGDAAYQSWVNEWGFVPAAPRLETFFTSMFMHAGFWHLAFNMLFLFIFGDNVEGRLGHVGYLLAYLACGLAAVLLFRALDPSSTLPQMLKRKVGAVCCAINGCAYCTAHSCAMLKRPSTGNPMLDEGWEMSEEDLQALIDGTAVAIRFETHLRLLPTP